MNATEVLSIARKLAEMTGEERKTVDEIARILQTETLGRGVTVSITPRYIDGLQVTWKNASGEDLFGWMDPDSVDEWDVVVTNQGVKYTMVATRLEVSQVR